MDHETHTKMWLGSFHMTELPDLNYDRWQVGFHDVVSCLNFPWGTAPIDLVLMPHGVVNASMAWDDREARRQFVEEVINKECMADLHRQYPELVEAERAIFSERAVDAEVIILSDDEEHGGDDSGKHDGDKDDEEFDIEKWRHFFPDSDDEA